MISDGEPATARRRAVAGVDSSTQSCKVVILDAETGEQLDAGSAPHPDGTEVDPRAWWDALRVAAGDRLRGVAAIGVGAQQHGMVTVDADGKLVRDALLWNDLRSAGQARALVEQRGAANWAAQVGSVPVASFTISKLAWLAEHEPDAAARVTQLMLPHDWLTWQLLGATGVATTDRADASGTGYYSARTGEYLRELVRQLLGHDVTLPPVLDPAAPAGTTPDSDLMPAGVVVSAGTGDNAAAALGLGLQPGEVVVSIGTSGTVFAVSDQPPNDPTGLVAGFADATGAYLPLVCTLNAARVLTSTAELLGVDLTGLEELAGAAEPDAGGVVLLPYLEGERTPDLPDATASLLGLSRTTMTRPNLARAAYLGMLCSLADGVGALVAQGVSPTRLLLIGGGARSATVRSAAAEIFSLDVEVPEADEYVARGAARQAAWALSGSAEPPAWPRRIAATASPRAGWGPTVRATYAHHRRQVYGV